MNDDKPIRGRCALCRCRAKSRIYGIKVCTYHVTHGESDPPCPYCLQYRLFDPRWTYTVTGERTPNKVQVRQMHLPDTIFFDRNGEAVLHLVSVPEAAPRGFPNKVRQSVVMIGIGLQMGTTFTITQIASDWERELIDAARPMLALTNRIYTIGRSAISVLAGDAYAAPPTWPTMNLRDKMDNVRRILDDQDIRSFGHPEPLDGDKVRRFWMSGDLTKREAVWRSNYFDVLDASMRIFQIEWPAEEAANG